MFGFDVPVREIAVNDDVYNGAAIEVSTPPGGLIDISSNRRIAVVEGRVVDAACHASEKSVRDSYYTWRPIVAPCPYFG